ncbi:hypothetical protein TNCV_3294391 [Trichonephila clavipes]|nr:hypothetical protein TNCV_3294391 [Trichonephila clavipes]
MNDEPHSRSFFSSSSTHTIESVPEPDELVIEVVDLAWQINLEDGDDVQELLDSHNQELTIDELVEMHKQEQDVEELESVDPVQSDERMTVGSLTEGLSLIEKKITHFRKYFFPIESENLSWESDTVDNETDEDEDNNSNESSKDLSNADVFSALETAMGCVIRMDRIRFSVIRTCPVPIDSNKRCATVVEKASMT